MLRLVLSLLGTQLHMFTFTQNIVSMLVVETVAVYLVLRLTLRLGLCNNIVESDAKTVIDAPCDSNPSSLVHWECHNSMWENLNLKVPFFCL